MSRGGDALPLWLCPLYEPTGFLISIQSLPFPSLEFHFSVQSQPGGCWSFLLLGRTLNTTLELFKDIRYVSFLAGESTVLVFLYLILKDLGLVTFPRGLIVHVILYSLSLRVQTISGAWLKCGPCRVSLPSADTGAQHPGTTSVLTPLTAFGGRVAVRSAPRGSLVHPEALAPVGGSVPPRPPLGPGLFLTPQSMGPSRLASKAPEVGSSLPGDPCPVLAHRPEFAAPPVSPIEVSPPYSLRCAP